MGGGIGQRRERALDELPRGELGGLANDLGDPLATHATAVHVREQEGIGVGRQTHAAKPVKVRDDLLNEVGTDLDLADAGLGLCVGNAEPRAGGVVQPYVAQAYVAQLTRP